MFFATDNDVTADTPQDPFRSVVGTGDADMVVKTPVRIITSAIHDVFGEEYVSIRACTSVAAVFKSKSGVRMLILSLCCLTAFWHGSAALIKLTR